MRAIELVAWSDLRRRWLGTIAAAVLVGIVGAIVLSTVGGARRSDSALARFNAYARSADIEITPGQPSGAQLAEFARTPGIAALAVLRIYALQPTNQSIQNLAIGAAVDARTMNNAVDRPRLTSGRLANPAAADEVSIGESLAQLVHLRVGDTLDLSSWKPKTVARILATNNFVGPDGPRIQLRIVGIVRRPLDLGERGGHGGVVVLPPAFNTKYGQEIGTFNGLAMRIRTVTPSDVQSVTARAQQIFGRLPNFQIQNLNVDNTGASDAIHVLALALFIFAAVSALAGVVAIAVVLNRELRLSRRAQPTLLALGLSRRQRFAISGIRVLLIAVVGSVIAVVGAVVASPLFPFGVARRADPDPGLHADWIVLGLGVAAIFLIVVAIGAVSALRATRAADDGRVARQPKLAARVVELSASAGLPASTTAGLRMAVEPGRGDQSVPVRSAFFAAAFAIAGLTAVIVFAASLSHLASTPSMYGSRFNFKVETSSDPACDRKDQGVGELAGVATLDAVCYDNIELDGHANIGFGDTPLRGSVGPEVVAGHAPETATEVALGASTFTALHKHIGDTVTAAGPGGHGVYRIVGRVVFPQLGDAQPVADGAWFIEPGFDTLLGPQGDPASQQFTRYLVGTYSPHANRAAVDAKVHKLVFDPTAPTAVASSGPQAPVEVTRLRQTDWFPTALAALLVFLALVAVGHALVTGTRRRRRELALLKTLGFERRQVRFAIAWQATTLAAAGLVVGIPIGLVTGIAIWHSVAAGVGVATTPVLPLPLLVVTLVSFALIAVNLLAYLPARAAARVRPALALRSE